MTISLILFVQGRVGATPKQRHFDWTFAFYEQRIALIRDATGSTQEGNLSILLVYAELKDTLGPSTRSKGLAKTTESRIAVMRLKLIQAVSLTKKTEAIQTIWTNGSYGSTFIQQGAME